MSIRGIMSCCPEAPSTINVTVNTVEMDGTTSFFARDSFTGATYLSLGYLNLSYSPYARASVALMLNTTVMVYGTDYTVNGDKIYLGFTPQAGDVLVATYFALTDGTSSVTNDSSLTTGMTMGYAGDTEPTGWLFCDGTEYPAALYADLYEWLGGAGASFEESRRTDDTGEVDVYYFTLKDLPSTYYDGSTLVTGTTIIKT